MNILGISGTPRKGGNSEILLNAALEPFDEAKWTIRKILLSDVKIEPCTGCETCVGRNECHISDDMGKIYEAYNWCDAVIISSPAYYRNVPAQLKAVIDRTFAMKDHPLKGKLGGTISVGRSTSGGGQTNVLNAIHNFYLSSGMLCVPGELNGVTASADKPGDILTQPHRLEQARILGRNIISYCR
ncbi:MAG: flavodoxin family protein [Oscillospiraceae bacterium]|jgi:multimeric flavodoxin WrbA|nr:flavodoxin family protein [Oscillospiraceae bacterium]